MSDEARSIVEDAAEMIDEAGGIGPFVQNYGIGGILYAWFLMTISAITTTGEMLLAPFRALASGLEELVGGTIGEMLNVIAAGAETAVTAFSEGLTALIGPFAFPFAVLIVMIAMYIFVQAIQRIGFDPLMFIRG